jgi:predicted RNase H-like HicB family nuclease
MPQIEVDLLTDQGNNAVIRLPGRTYPGIVVQGDTLSILLDNLQEVKALIITAQSKDAIEALNDVIEDLLDIQIRYDKACEVRS